MTKVIYKYPLKVTDHQAILMPTGQILALQVQNGIPCIWLFHDKDGAMQNYNIRTIGTGHDIHDMDHLSHIGTYQLEEGRLAFHVFIEGQVLLTTSTNG